MVAIIGKKSKKATRSHAGLGHVGKEQWVRDMQVKPMRRARLCFKRNVNVKWQAEVDESAVNPLISLKYPVGD
jgi:hypothetical protein